MTSITSLPSASLPLTGGERVPMDQTVGSAVAASALVVGTGYRIETVGTTNWTACGLPAGVTAAVGLTFVATAAGTGTGTAIEVETREATTGAIAALAPAANLAYDEATRLLSSSTGQDVTLPLFSPTLAGLVAASGGGTTTFLRADGTWASPPGGGGTVTSVSLSAPTGFNVSGSPVTSTGTLALSFAAGYSLPTDTRQADWDAAFTQRRSWDGGNQHLNAATGRASLELAAVASTGAYGDLSGRPILATVATTGAYSDLSGKPSLGTAAAAATSDFVSATATRAANVVLTGPASGAAAAPTFRALLAADLPATAVAAGSYGSGSSVAAFTVDAQGRLTAVNNVTISLAATAISDSTITGRAVLTAFDAAAARNAISAETAGAAAAAQAAAVQRSNHTGTQLADTISDFSAAVAALGTTVGNALRSLVNPSAVSFLRINSDNTVSARSASEMREDLALTSAATATIGTAAGNLVALDGSARLPAVDGSQLTNVPSAGTLPAYRVGGYIPTSETPFATGPAVAINTIFFYPFRVLRAARVGGTQVRVITAQAGTFQIAIYAASSVNVPTGTPLVATGDLSMASGTLVNATITPTWLYPGQIYFRAVNVTGAATGTFTAPSPAVPEFMSLVGSLTNGIPSGTIGNIEFSFPWTYGSWPDMSTRTVAEINTPRVFVSLLVNALA
jgi:hypothetical protein